MRLLFIIDHLGQAGAQHQLMALAVALADRGHEIDVFIYHARVKGDSSALRDAGVRVIAYRKRSRFDVGPVFSLRKQIKSEQYDVALSFLTTPNLYNVLATAGSSTRSVVSERSAFSTARLPVATRVHYNTYRFADHVVANSRHQFDRLRREFPWMSASSSFIANGVDLEKFEPVSGTDRWDSRTDGVRLLAVGSIQEGKNFLGLIEALRIYRDSYGPPPTIDWVGRESSRESDQDAHKRALQILERTRLDSHWNWLGQRNDIPLLLNEHSALIHPSLFEGLPNAVCEALGSGTPVLASDVCDHPWLVEAPLRGLVFNPLDPQAIAATIRQFVLLSPEEKKEMGKRARTFAEQTLSIKALADNYEQLFVRLMSRQSPAENSYVA